MFLQAWDMTHRHVTKTAFSCLSAAFPSNWRPSFRFRRIPDPTLEVFPCLVCSKPPEPARAGPVLTHHHEGLRTGQGRQAHHWAVPGGVDAESAANCSVSLIPYTGPGEQGLVKQTGMQSSSTGREVNVSTFLPRASLRIQDEWQRASDNSCVCIYTCCMQYYTPYIYINIQDVFHVLYTV